MREPVNGRPPKPDRDAEVDRELDDLIALELRKPSEVLADIAKLSAIEERARQYPLFVKAAAGENGVLREMLVRRAVDVFGVDARRIHRDVADVSRCRVVLLPARDLVAPPVEWHIDGVIAKGMLHLLAGKDGLGKTLLAMEMMSATLSGRPFLGQFSTRQGPVAALLLDDPASLTKERLEQLGIKDHPDLWLSVPGNVDLADPLAMLRDLGDVITERKVRLVIIDALYLLLPTTRDAGNDSARMGPIMTALNGLAERTDAAVLLVAHDRKDGTDVAGSYAVRAAAKVILRLLLPRGEKVDPDDGPTTHERVLQLNKSKLTGHTAWRLRLDGPGAWTLHGTNRDYRREELNRLVREELKRSGAVSPKALAERIGRRPADVLIAVDALGVERVVEPPTGKRGRPRELVRLKEPDLSSRDVGNENTPAEGVGNEIPGSNPAPTRTSQPQGDFRSQVPSLGGGNRERKSREPVRPGPAAVVERLNRLYPIQPDREPAPVPDQPPRCQPIPRRQPVTVDEGDTHG